jgi:hypothetical protein
MSSWIARNWSPIFSWISRLSALGGSKERGSGALAVPGGIFVRRFMKFRFPQPFAVRRPAGPL